MDARELRIGNWVNAEPYGDYKIVALTIFPTGSQSAFKSIEYYPESSSIDRLNPIPLTEEWLLKFGYFKLDHLGTIHFVVKGHTIWLCNDLLMCEKNGIILKYVHQLQNLYFALTGNELTLNE